MPAGIRRRIFLMPEKTNTFTSPLKDEAQSILSASYWKEAAKNFKDIKMIAFASLIIALRIAVKFIVIPVDIGVDVSFDCYINSLGSLVYGPLMGLLVGAVSDTLGCLLHPTGPYFFPFIFVEMSSSFIFGLFLWKRKLSAPRVLLSKFTVNFICNIILTSAIMKPFMSIFYGKGYNFINLTRIVKNLVMFPIEAMLITLILGAVIPAFKSMHLIDKNQENISLRKKDIVMIAVLLALSVGLVLFYIFFLKQFVADHNIKLF